MNIQIKLSFLVIHIRTFQKINKGNADESFVILLILMYEDILKQYKKVYLKLLEFKFKKLGNSDFLG